MGPVVSLEHPAQDVAIKETLHYELATSGNNFLVPRSSAMSITPVGMELLSKSCRLCSLEVNAKSPKSPVTHQAGAEQVLGLLMAIAPSPGCRNTAFGKLSSTSSACETFRGFSSSQERGVGVFFPFVLQGIGKAGL